MNADEAAKSFALNVATLRRSRKMTLDQLANATGLTKGYLSRLERGEKSPSIATVLKVSEAFSVPVAALVGQVTEDSSIHLVRKGDAHPARGRGPDDWSFTKLTNAQSDGLEAFVLYPSSEPGTEGASEHLGTEIVYVLAGRVEIRFADRALELGAGDFAQFPGHLHHKLRDLGTNATVLVAIAKDR